jgi:hypothetical protein
MSYRRHRLSGSIRAASASAEAKNNPCQNHIIRESTAGHCAAKLYNLARLTFFHNVSQRSLIPWPVTAEMGMMRWPRRFRTNHFVISLVLLLPYFMPPVNLWVVLQLCALYNYCMDEFDFPKVRRDVFKVTSLSDSSDDKEYWMSKTPEERLEAVELMRRIVYGDEAIKRLQRVLEITQRT